MALRCLSHERGGPAVKERNNLPASKGFEIGSGFAAPRRPHVEAMTALVLADHALRHQAIASHWGRLKQ